jgi:hypothetical protein
VTRRAPVFRWCLDPLSLTRQAVRVGELTQHPTRWEFLYDPDYLSLGSAAWELDPTGIRNKQRSAHVHVGVTPPPVFCDLAAPVARFIIWRHGRRAAQDSCAHA